MPAPPEEIREPDSTDLGYLKVFGTGTTRGAPPSSLEAVPKPIDFAFVRLVLEVDLPDAVVPAVFWYDGSGNLRRYEMTSAPPQGRTVHWTWSSPAESTSEDNVAKDAELRSWPPQSGTNVIVVCASGPASPSLESLENAFKDRKPWPSAPGDWMLRFDVKAVAIATSPAGVGKADPANVEARLSGLRDRAEEMRITLAKRFDYFSGIVFPVVAATAEN